MIVGRTYVAAFPNKIFLVNVCNVVTGVGNFTFKVQYIDNAGGDIDQSIKD